MTPTPPTTLVVSLIVVFVVLFALGIYWMLRKPLSRRLAPRQREAAWHADPALFDPLDDDEWETQAPYPEHVMRAMQEARASTPPFGDRCDPAPAQSLDTSHEAQWEDMPSDSTPPASSVQTSASTSPVRCPRCLSSRIDTRNVARKAGSTIGSVAGATGGMAAALAGAETGAVVGAFAGPMGSVFGGLAGAVIAGLVGSAAGCAAGSAVGAAIDDNVLDNHHCLACGHAFSVAQH